MEDEELISEYKLTLSELVTNAKITINVLSMLADENKKFAPQIAETIEERIRTAIPNQKLPTLYLVDSIIKNVKDSDYLKIFTKNIVSLFVCVFERGDEKIRSAMYKLRQTWVELFSNDVLLKLDLAVNSIDPAWPITAVRPAVGQQTVHLNPDFLNKAKEALKGLTSTSGLKIARQTEAEKLSGDRKEDHTSLVGSEAGPGGVAVSSGPSNISALGSEAEILFQKQLMAKQLLAKQQELLQIQQRRVEIELAKAQMQIEQAKQLAQLKPKQCQEALSPTAIADEDKSPKKSKIKRNRTLSNGEGVAGGTANEKAQEEPKSPLKNKVVEPIRSEPKLNSQKIPVSVGKTEVDSGVDKPAIRKRKSGEGQKVDPRLRKKMMLNKDGLSTSLAAKVEVIGEKQKVEKAEKVEEAKKAVKETKLSEDLKDLFGNEDKDFRTQLPSIPKTSETQWKVLKSEGKMMPSFNFAQNKFVGGDRRMGINNKFGPYARHLGVMHGNRKTLLPTPAPIFGQDLKPRQSSLENFEKLQAIKKELDVEAERLNSLNCDVSKNVDFEAFEADVMRGNSLLNKARWNNWRQGERGGIKRLRRQSGEQFHNGPPFTNRPHPRSLLHAPPRANFPEIQPHRPSPPPHQQFSHQPSPPQFNHQPRSPGQGNYDRGCDGYAEENYDRFGGEGRGRHPMDPHYHHDDGRRSPTGGSWNNYHQVPNHHNHNPPMKPSNSTEWRGPQPIYTQSSLNPAASSNPRRQAISNVSSQGQNCSTSLPSSQASDKQYVSQLFSKLTKFGILNNIMTSVPKEKAEIPKMSNFDLNKMKTKYRSLVDNLNSGTLCRTCGLTFPPTGGVDRKKGEEHAKARYLMHLDWHFQVNRKASTFSRAERWREYYPDPDSWYVHEVVNVTRVPVGGGEDAGGDRGGEDPAGNSGSGKSKNPDGLEERMESARERHKGDLVTFVYKDAVKPSDLCFICNEGFESYWDDEREEWGLREAYALKEKLFHSSCFLEFDEHESTYAVQQQSTSDSDPLKKEIDEPTATEVGNETHSSPSLDDVDAEKKDHLKIEPEDGDGKCQSLSVDQNLESKSLSETFV